MSVQAMAWVWGHSRSEPMDRLVLLAIADTANDTGTDAYPSMTRLTAKTGLHERTIQRALNRLVALGELVVYPNAGPRGCNRYRLPMTPGTAPPRHSAGGGTETPRQSATPPAHSHPTPGTTPGVPPAQRHPNHPLTIHQPSEEPSSSVTPRRPDVEEICAYLADKIEANGSRRPRVTPRWRAEARLLLDADGRTVEQVKRAVDWCQADAFWRSNVLSMPKLREKYDQLRLAAQRPNGRASPGVVDVNGLKVDAKTAERLTTDRERLAALDAELNAIEGPK